MKKYISILSAGFIFLASCTDQIELTPLSESTTVTFYTTQNDFVQATTAVYNSLRTYPNRQLNLSETRSDNLYAVDGVREWDPINGFHKTIATNIYVTDAWRDIYAGIFRANTVLDQIQKNGSVITDTSLKTRLEAETKFLRALFYFDLVRFFGKVPLIDLPLSNSEALSVKRSPVSAVYDLIISDLQFAAQNLPMPDTYTAAEKGRASQYAAKGLLALVYMTRSAPAYGIEGPTLGLSEWDKALSLLNEIIASNKYSFVPGFGNIFSYTNENNAEVIFDVQFLGGGLGVGGNFAQTLAVDAWFRANGKTAQGAVAIRPLSNELLNSFSATDVRKTFSVQPGYTLEGVTETNSFIKKYVDLTKVPTTNTDWPINFIVLRYTDVLMMKAECILRGAAGTKAEVDAIMSQVQTRAMGTPTTVSGTTLPQLFEERRKEFLGEGLRWHDLVRSGTIVQTVTNWIAVEDVKHVILPFTVNDILYPVPQSELDAGPGLYEQNPGY